MGCLSIYIGGGRGKIGEGLCMIRVGRERFGDGQGIIRENLKFTIGVDVFVAHIVVQYEVLDAPLFFLGALLLRAQSDCEV